jgi:hypothetical protein
MLFKEIVTVYTEKHMKPTKTKCRVVVVVVVHVDGVRLRLLMPPPTGLLFISQVIYEYEQPRWNDIDRKNPKNSEKGLSQYHFVHQKPYMN